MHGAAALCPCRLVAACMGPSSTPQQHPTTDSQAPTSPLMVSLLANSGMVSTSSRLFFTVTVGCTPPLAAAAAEGRSSNCTVQGVAPTSPPNSLFCG